MTEDDVWTWTAAPSLVSDWSCGKSVVLCEDSVIQGWLNPDEAECLARQLMRAAKVARERMREGDK